MKDSGAATFSGLIDLAAAALGGYALGTNDDWGSSSRQRWPSSASAELPRGASSPSSEANGGWLPRKWLVSMSTASTVPRWPSST
jgi:hypothetical protein